MQPIPDVVLACSYSLYSIESIGLGCKIQCVDRGAVLVFAGATNRKKFTPANTG
jgi:hypothetical protein